MAPAFSSLLNRASQMGHLITRLSSAQSFWPPSCLLFLLAAPHLTVLCLAGAEATKPWGLGVAGALSRTNKRPAVPNAAGGILRKYRSQHSQEPLPPLSEAWDAKKYFAAIRQRLHFQRVSW